MAKEVTKFLKSRVVKSPSRGFPTDAGIDFFVPVFNAKFIKDFKEKNPELFEWSDTTRYPNICGSSVSLSSSCSGTLTLAGPSSEVKYELDDHNDSIFKFDENKGEAYFLLPPHKRALIPAGIHSRMAKEGRALIASNKSGVASKLGLVFGAQVVDYTYQGEIHINVINTSTKVVRIYQNMKLIQFVETPVFTNDIEVTEPETFEFMASEYLNFYEGIQQDRKAGGFGSTDKK